MNAKIWICALAGILTAAVGQSQLPWEAAYWDAIDNLKETPMSVKLWAEEVQDRAIVSGDCDSLNLARAVLTTMLNVKGGEAPLESSWVSDATCDTSGYVTWYSIGVHHYLNHRLKEARAAFERSLTYGPITSRQVSTWHAIGSLSNQLGDLETAYDAYKKAFELEPEPDNPLRLNNLATINLSLHDYEAALDWLKLAEEAWLKRDEDLAQKLPEDFGEVILRNRLLCTYELEMWNEAEAIFNRLTPGEFTGQDPIAGATIILNYLLRSNRFDVYVRLKGPLTRAFETDSARTVYSLGAAAQLFSPWRPANRNEKELWQQIQGAPGWTWQSPWADPVNGEQTQVTSAIEGELGVDPSRSPLSPISWGTLLLLVGGGLGQFRIRSQRKRSQEIASSKKDAFKEDLDKLKAVAEMLKGSPEHFDFERLPWLASEPTSDNSAPSLSELREKVPEWEDLTDREKEVMYWTLRGASSAELAERLGCKKSHVYNLRTRIRTKLNLENNADLKDWWRSLPFWVLMLSGTLGATVSSAAASDWNTAMKMALVETERPDTLDFLTLDTTEAWSSLEKWNYHVWAAVATNDSGRITALPPLPSPAPAWLLPFSDHKDQNPGHLTFAALQLTAPRIVEHLRREQSPETELSILETEDWVQQGTPEEQRLARLKQLQWGLFVAALFSVAFAAFRWRQNLPKSSDAIAIEHESSILTPSDVALSRSVIEQCLASSHPSSAEVRSAAFAAEILGLPIREQQALNAGKLPAIWHELTQKEKQVAFLLALRYPPQQIAEILQSAPAYIYNLKSVLRKKWGLANSSELDRALMDLI